LILAGSQAYYALADLAPDLVERSEEADVLLVVLDRLAKLARNLREWKREDLAVKNF
jgi:hypothetical protein